MYFWRDIKIFAIGITIGVTFAVVVAGGGYWLATSQSVVDTVAVAPVAEGTVDLSAGYQQATNALGAFTTYFPLVDDAGTTVEVAGRPVYLNFPDPRDFPGAEQRVTVWPNGEYFSTSPVGASTVHLWAAAAWALGFVLMALGVFGGFGLAALFIDEYDYPRSSLRIGRWEIVKPVI